MFISKEYAKKLEARIAELEDVLTEKEGATIGSEIDRKVCKEDFEKFKKEVIGKNPGKSIWEGLSFWTIVGFDEANKEPNPTILERLSALEKHLKIEYVTEEKKFKGYKEIKGKK